ncbi:hypothetical protein [Sulfitobacter aestuariivivens]|uniref:Uncharacterized protein n=1 Tax=Sulfitobacter aestuariivivens TaxID=2766981 RepID=A0A927HFJ2_9RHOB|nr:hypothetical protein [Sulfitobacter aestuariivivens]MBD3664494.1 hypothetical protein [Sulfitobacter aestuariivivens]
MTDLEYEMMRAGAAGMLWKEQEMLIRAAQDDAVDLRIVRQSDVFTSRLRGFLQWIRRADARADAPPGQMG